MTGRLRGGLPVSVNPASSATLGARPMILLPGLPDSDVLGLGLSAEGRGGRPGGFPSVGEGRRPGRAADGFSMTGWPSRSLFLPGSGLPGIGFPGNGFPGVGLG